LFKTDWRSLLKNKLLLQKNYNTTDIDSWPFFELEENISIINEITDEEDKERKKQEDNQKTSTPNFNPNNYMKNIGNIANKFKK
jgi:hypothetical protein